jgi:hypothetical protein
VPSSNKTKKTKKLSKGKVALVTPAADVLGPHLGELLEGICRDAGGGEELI